MLSRLKTFLGAKEPEASLFSSAQLAACAVLLEAAHADGRARGCGVSALRKKVSSKPKRRPVAVARLPVKYHHSVRYSGWAPWSRGKDHTLGPWACAHWP